MPHRLRSRRQPHRSSDTSAPKENVTPAQSTGTAEKSYTETMETLKKAETTAPTYSGSYDQEIKKTFTKRSQTASRSSMTTRPTPVWAVLGEVPAARQTGDEKTAWGRLPH